jgi:peptidyl-prolyl cis-trans isomerase D
MLTTLRDHASSWVFKALLGMLIVSFGVWGIGDIFLGERDPVVSKVGGVNITVTQLNQAFRDEIRRAQPMVSQPLDNEQAKQLGLLDSALQRMQNNILFSLGSKDLGIVVSDDMLRQEIAREKAFHNPQGQFDPRIFQQVLSASGFTEQSYVQRLRLDLATTRLAGAVTANVPVPTQMLDALHKYHAEQRVAEYVTVPKSAADGGTPSDEELQSFYEAHPDQFTAPELRSVAVLRLDPKLLAKGEQVSDERVKQEYDARIAEFTVPDRREIEQAVFSDQGQAEAAVKAITAGKSFADAAREASGGHVSVVKLGTVEKSDLVTDVADTAFSTRVGAVSAPVKSPLGWHLLRIVREEKGRVSPLAEVASKIKAEIATREAQDSLYSLSNKLEDELAGGATLNEAGKRLGLPVTAIARVDARGMDENGKPTPLADEPNLLRLVAQTPEGQESQVADIGGGAYGVVRVSEIVAPHVRPLDDVRADAVASWQADKRAKATRARADAILEKLKGGASLADIAKAEKLAVKTTPAFNRATHDSESGLPPSLTARVFALKVGEAAIGESSDGVVVARLKEIKAADPVKDPATRNQIAEALARSMGADLMDEFVGGLRDRYTVTVRQDVLAQRF